LIRPWAHGVEEEIDFVDSLRHVVLLKRESQRTT